jgi:hypothetical protein
MWLCIRGLSHHFASSRCSYDHQDGVHLTFFTGKVSFLFWPLLSEESHFFSHVLKYSAFVSCLFYSFSSI